MSWNYKAILGIALIPVVIGGVTYLAQFATRGKTNAQAQAVSPLLFLRTQAIWDVNDQKFRREEEPFHEGHYDFPFYNKSESPFEIGLEANGCDCARVLIVELAPEAWDKLKLPALDAWDALAGQNIPPEIAEANAPWKQLTVKQERGFVIPANRGGIVRVTWNSSKAPGEDLNLHSTLWLQPEKNAADRTRTKLTVPIVLSSPINFQAKRGLHADQGYYDLGPLKQGKSVRTEFALWSGTRPAGPFQIKTDHLPKNVEAKIVPMNAQECAVLETEMKAIFNTRVLSAARLEVVVHEEKDGAQLDLGPVGFEFPLELPDYPRPMANPKVLVHVQGEIEIGTGADRGKVNLGSFPRTLDKEKTISILAPENAELTFVEVQGVESDRKIEVTLKPIEVVGKERRWELRVLVPAPGPFGPFSSEAAILLQIKSNQTRKVRVPLLGSGVT